MNGGHWLSGRRFGPSCGGGVPKLAHRSKIAWSLRDLGHLPAFLLCAPVGIGWLCADSGAYFANPRLTSRGLVTWGTQHGFAIPFGISIIEQEKRITGVEEDAAMNFFIWSAPESQDGAH